MIENTAKKLAIVVLSASLSLLSAGGAAEGDRKLSKVLNDEGVVLSKQKQGEIEYFRERMYTNVPWQLKCSEYDYRTFNGCIRARYFDPAARIYIDSGKDDPGEIDIFNDGALNASIDFVSIHLPWRFGRSTFYDAWTWGPQLGVGIISAAEDSDDGTEKASSAPVVVLSYGFLFEYRPSLDKNVSFGFELGRATGFSADESVSDNDDTATYVGLKIRIPTE